MATVNTATVSMASRISTGQTNRSHVLPDSGDREAAHDDGRSRGHEVDQPVRALIGGHDELGGHLGEARRRGP